MAGGKDSDVDLDWTAGADPFECDLVPERFSIDAGFAVTPQAANDFRDYMARTSKKAARITGYGKSVFGVGAQVLGLIVMTQRIKAEDALNKVLDLPQPSSEEELNIGRAARREFYDFVYGGVPRPQ